MRQRELSVPASLGAHPFAEMKGGRPDHVFCRVEELGDFQMGLAVYAWVKGK